MKKQIITITLVMSFSVLNFAQQMGELTKIKVNNQPITCLPSYISTTIYDYDHDGLQDLIIGMFEGSFRFYKNIGTKTTPVYKDFVFIQANGKKARINNW
jgi:predicted AlkP superfamily phosphohydrolase/phosphomutase